jgi:cytochrome b561
MQDGGFGYSNGQRGLHWIMAILILPMIIVGFLMVQQGLPRALQNTMFILHKNIGVVVLILAVLRVALRLRRTAPPLQASMPAWQRRAAHASHGLLYMLILVMPLSGYIRVRAGGFPIEALDRLGLPTLVPRSDALANAAKLIHEIGAYAIVALLLLHIAAALQHALLLRDGTWARIWPPVTRR